MAEVVLDASAVIAFLRHEPGAELVASCLPGAAISTVNVAEVGDHYVRNGGDLHTIDAMIAGLRLWIIPPDTALALDASQLLAVTRAAGLSLGDRFCIALGRRLDRPVLTGDRQWQKVQEALGVRVELIR